MLFIFGKNNDLRRNLPIQAPIHEQPVRPVPANDQLFDAVAGIALKLTKHLKLSMYNRVSIASMLTAVPAGQYAHPNGR